MFWSLFSQRLRTIVGVLLLALFWSGCRQNAPLPLASKTVSDSFAIKVGEQTVQMQLAIFSAEMEHGLMERSYLGSDQGMLFVYREPTQMSFWMRNTQLPLEIYTMLPYDEKTTGSRSNALQFALEMNQGWFRTHGLKPGMKLDLVALREALKARGVTPEDFGLR
jgi:hypothetical protein